MLKGKMTTSPYSNRKKVINYLNQSKKEASEVFGIQGIAGRTVVLQYLGLGRKSKLSYQEIELFVKYNPDVSLSDIIGSKFLISAWHAKENWI